MKLNGLDNLALGKTVRQSSVPKSNKFSFNDASRPLTGDGKWDFAFHTDIEDNPWWQIDLGDAYPIHYIVIGNHRKAYQERLITMTVETSQDGQVWRFIHVGLISWDDDLIWPLGGLVSARFVRLSLREKTYFHLDKVEVWGIREGGFKPDLNGNNVLWTETKPEGRQELQAAVTSPAGQPEMILDLGDLHPVWALELTVPMEIDIKGVNYLKIAVSHDGRGWLIIHEGLLCWTGRIYYPLQGEIMARFIKISWSDADKKHPGLRRILQSLLHRRSSRCDCPPGWPLVKIFTRRQPDIQVWSLRYDGLGARLIGLLQAMYMARLLGCDYKFVWEERTFAEKVAHSAIYLDDAREVFDADYIQAHILTAQLRTKKSRAHAYGGPHCHRHFTGTDKQDRPGVFYSTLSQLIDFYHSRLVPPVSHFKSLFESLPFSPAYQEVIAMARRVELPPHYVAVHVRSGDIVFSDLRKEILLWQEKAAPLPLLKLTLETLCSGKRPIILFGQDADALAYLAGCYKVPLATDFLPSRILTSPQRDLFEIVLMSRASDIYNCHRSAYSDCAALIGGNVNRIEIHGRASPKDKTAYLKADLERNAAFYHPLHNSFSYLYLYHLNHLTADQEELAFYLNQAQFYDPENETVNLLRATEYFKHGNEKAGEEMLESWLKLDFNLDRRAIQYDSTNRFFNPAPTPRYLNVHMSRYGGPLKFAAKQGQPAAAAVISIMYDLSVNQEQAMFWREAALKSKAAQSKITPGRLENPS